MPRPAARTTVLALLVLSTLLAGCSLPGSGPDPDAAAKVAAKALTDGKAAEVPWEGDARAAAAAYAKVVAGLGSAKPEVNVTQVRTDGDKATGSLSWSWHFGTRTWQYAAPISLSKGTRAGRSAWLVTWSPTLVEGDLRTGERLVATRHAAERANILGAGGAPIVVPRPVVTVGLDKAKISQAPAQVALSAGRLARLLGIDVAGFTKLARASGPKAFVAGITFRRNQVPAAVRNGLAGITGAVAQPGTLPLAPSKDFAAALLGTVGPATAEIVKDSEGRVQAGDVVGLSGLQKRYDEQLAGEPGLIIAAVDATGTARTLHQEEPKAGTPLRTTIQPRLQQLAQDDLAGIGPASALVAIRPSTGDLVAVASGPGSKGYNTATVGQYAPGSTFKIVSSLALLRSGEQPTTTVPCTPTTVVDGKRFKNYSDYPPSGLGTITLETALANSCNTAFISQRDKLRSTSLADAAAALGLGTDHDTGFPSYFGKVGPPQTETQRAASMIGQGTVLASPMAMATVVASVLKGSAVVPRLLPDQKTDSTAPDHPLTVTEARELRQMMRAVVQRGSGARLAGLGPGVIAKTGTAEFGDKPPLPTHAWMVAGLPAGQGDLAVAVFVDRGATGSTTAGPILQAFLERAR